ncbi:MAG: YcxB-like protein [Kribbellaceae bacterium]|jgi:hypothetical protein|nr:YcxB-like protein [Kribbellaceae bacterium]
MNVVIVVENSLRRRLRNARQQRWVLGLVVRGLGVLYLAFAFLARDLMFVALAVILFLLPEVIAVVAQLLARKYGPTYTYALTDDAIKVTTVVSHLEFVWDAVKSVRQTSNAWHVRVAGGVTITLPKDGFTPDQDAEWRSFLASRSLVRT